MGTCVTNSVIIGNRVYLTLWGPLYIQREILTQTVRGTGVFTYIEFG